MPSILSAAICAALLLVNGTYGAPTRSRLAKRSFSVERVAHGTRTLNGPLAMGRAFAKFGMTPPDGLSSPHLLAASSSFDSAAGSGSASSGTGSGDGEGGAPGSGGPGAPSGGSSGSGSTTNGNVSATPDTQTPATQAAEYLSPVTIGGQKLMLDFDTGSADIPLFSTEQAADQISGRQSGVYDRSKSTTFKKLPGETWNITYGDGSTAFGHMVGTDIMDIGGVQATQAIELASSMSPSFIRDKSSAGLVGLAFSSINQVKPTQQKTFFDTVQNDLAQPVFTAALKDGTPGSYAFGRIDYPTPLNFIPVDSSQGFWQFASSSFKVGDDPTVIPNKDNSPAIADTGTSLLLADKSVVTGYYSKVTGAINDDSQGGWIYPCVSTMPALSIALGDSQYGSIPANLLTYASLNTTHCFGSLQSNNGQGFQIFGDILFKAMFVAFNIKDKTIAFAPHI